MTRLLLLAIVLLAFALRWLLPSHNGLTLYLPQHTRYLPLNVVAFWSTLGLALLVAAAMLLYSRRT